MTRASTTKAACLLAGTLIAGLMAAPIITSSAQAQSVYRNSSDPEYRVRHRRTQRPDADRGQQIACTTFGCAPIPRGCHVEAQKYWATGLTTGYDAIVCP